MSQTLAQPEVEKPDKELALHYIDKLYSTQCLIWESMNRILITEIILSVVLISIASGTVSLDEAVEVTGLKIKISLSVVLSAGAIIIAMLFTQFVSQFNHSHKFRDKITELYSKIEYSDPGREIEAQAFEAPGSFWSIIATTRGDTSNWFVDTFSISFSMFIVIGIMAIMPLIAQIACGLKVAALFGHRWWIYLLFSMLVIFTIIFIFSAFYEEKAKVEKAN
jgi:hypothetical protein